MEDWTGLRLDTEPGLLQSDLPPARSRGFLPGGADWRLGHGQPGRRNKKLALQSDCFLTKLQVSDTSALARQSERQPCPRCNRSRKFFCYTCLLPLPGLQPALPRVSLPVKVEIVKHPGEVNGKSTAVHAAILAPDWVSLHNHPEIPDYRQESETTALVFPGPNSCSLADWEGAFPFTKLVFIDSTWHQCYGILQDPRLAGLPQVRLDRRQTQFWRTQSGKPREFLATIEAVYWVCVEHYTVLGGGYSGQCDDLLWLFKFMFEKIHQLHTGPGLEDEPFLGSGVTNLTDKDN